MVKFTTFKKKSIIPPTMNQPIPTILPTNIDIVSDELPSPVEPTEPVTKQEESLPEQEELDLDAVINNINKAFESINKRVSDIETLLIKLMAN